MLFLDESSRMRSISPPEKSHLRTRSFFGRKSNGLHSFVNAHSHLRMRATHGVLLYAGLARGARVLPYMLACCAYVLLYILVPNSSEQERWVGAHLGMCVMAWRNAVCHSPNLCASRTSSFELPGIVE